VKNVSGGAIGADLQAAIAAADAGDVLAVRGVCTGHFTIDRDLTLAGPATLNGTTCVDDYCDAGIVVWVNDGKVKLRDLTVTGGSSTYDGGGIHNYGDLTLSSTVVRDNLAEDNAGGIYNEGRLVLSSSAVRDNEIFFGAGGGIYNRGTVVLNGTSTVTGNYGTYGGGIYNAGTVVMNRASSVTGNTAELGGGIRNDGGRVWFSRHWHGTLCGNTPDDWPGC
jgi:nitrous oxidase accessory protein NosD